MRKFKIIFVLILMLVLTGCRSSKLNQLKDENDKLTEDNLILNERIINITKENEDLREQLEEEEKNEKECTFIRTYIVKDILDFQIEGEDSKYVILDQFQINEPFLVKLKNNQVSKLEQNKFFEFTFTGSTKHRKSEQNFIFKNYKLTTIKSTNKIGLEQIQESCQ